MNEEFLKQLIAELLHAQGEALGLLTAALVRQIDASRLAEDLRRQMKAAELIGNLSPTAKKLVLQALAAADSESALQNRSRQ